MCDGLRLVEVISRFLKAAALTYTYMAQYADIEGMNGLEYVAGS